MILLVKDQHILFLIKLHFVPSSCYRFEICSAFVLWFLESSEEHGAKVENLNHAEDWEACEKPHGAANQPNPLQKHWDCLLKSPFEFFFFEDKKRILKAGGPVCFSHLVNWQLSTLVPPHLVEEGRVEVEQHHLELGLHICSWKEYIGLSKGNVTYWSSSLTDQTWCSWQSRPCARGIFGALTSDSSCNCPRLCETRRRRDRCRRACSQSSCCWSQRCSCSGFRLCRTVFLSDWCHSPRGWGPTGCNYISVGFQSRSSLLRTHPLSPSDNLAPLREGSWNSQMQSPASTLLWHRNHSWSQRSERAYQEIFLHGTYRFPPRCPWYVQGLEPGLHGQLCLGRVPAEVHTSSHWRTLHGGLCQVLTKSNALRWAQRAWTGHRLQSPGHWLSFPTWSSQTGRNRRGSKLQAAVFRFRW